MNASIFMHGAAIEEAQNEICMIEVDICILV